MNHGCETQSERLDYLLDKMKEDSIEYRGLKVGESEEEKRVALRSLMNIRMPRPMDLVTMKIQDAYLQEDAREKGIVFLKEIKTIREQYNSTHASAEKIAIWQGDITRLEIDAIVNAANSQMLGCFVPCHRCIDNAIHSAAGMELRQECYHQMKEKKIRYGSQYEEPTGQAMLTKGYNLPANYVIHTVGPIVGYGLTEGLKQDLKHCYESILECCLAHQIRSVAFCCISTGEFHFPNDEAAKIAVETVDEYLLKNPQAFDKIVFTVYKEYDLELYKELLV